MKSFAEPEPGYAKHPRVDLLPGGYGSAPYVLAERAHYWSEVTGKWITIEAVRFFALSYDGKQATNYVEVRWP